MAVDNLNYYSSGLPAGQQTDKYSNLPGFLKSKNLDIFSSSKSVRGTAWSEREQKASGVVDVTPDGQFELREDGVVYDTYSGSRMTPLPTSFYYYNIKHMRKVNYGSGTEDFSAGTPLKLWVKYGPSGGWETITVVTTTCVYVKYRNSSRPKPQIFNCSNCTVDDNGNVRVNNGASSCYFDLCFDTPGWGNIDFKLWKSDWAYGNVTLDYVRAYRTSLQYNPHSDNMEFSSRSYYTIATTPPEGGGGYMDDPTTWNNTTDEAKGLTFRDMPCASKGSMGDYGIIRVRLNVIEEDGTTFDGKISVEADYTSQESYTVRLPKVGAARRQTKQFGEWYLISNTKSAGVWAFDPRYSDDPVVYNSTVWYDFLQESAAPWMVGEKFADIVVADQYIYKFSNVDDVGYISIYGIDDPAGENVITSSYSGIEFIGATRLNNIIYVVAKDRGVSGLYGYNGQELVKIISGDVYTAVGNNYDLIDSKEQYRFTGIEMWRGNILLTTDDEKLFMYGDTYGGKGMSVIFQADRIGGETIQKLMPLSGGLEVLTKQGGVSYVRKYMDRVTNKNYLSEREVTYPITVGNHILEKEESDLYASYMLPSKDCKLEFWGLGNQYHYWTFTSTDNVTLNPNERYYIYTGHAIGDYYLQFIERNGDQYTFKLVGDMPYQKGNTAWKPRASSTGGQGGSIRIGTGQEVLEYSYYNHFRKIGEVTADGYTEDYVRFHNINNKLELPKTHSIQIMVKGFGTTQYTPELFGLNLVANQRDRG